MSAKKKAKKTRAKAKPLKKVAKKRAGARKAAKKKTGKKTAPGKAKVKQTAKKTAVKKTAKKTAVKKTAKKTAVKKTAKKTAVKKTTPRKAQKKTARKPVARAQPKKKVVKKTPARAKAPAPAPAESTPAPPEAPTKKPRKSRRRSSRRSQVIRRGPDGEILAPGDLLLPGGATGAEEAQYLFRGSMAAEHPVGEEVIVEILTRRNALEDAALREELQAELDSARERFGQGDLEPVIPVRANLRRTFQGVVERARQRRREIGAFLRGLDLGHTETSHMDAHGEASLQSLMEWAARLENLVENFTEAPDTNQAHYVQFHRVLDQLEGSTEALIIDVEQTLRRLRDRLT